MEIDGFIYETGEKKSETKAARNLGEKIIKEAQITEPPIDVFSIVEKNYNIKLRQISLNDDISAIVDLGNNEITLNKDKNHNHIRFTLAHELGHIVLNHKERRWTEYSAYIGSSNPDKKIEEEANAFASGLLMPKFILTKLANKKTTPDRLAELFQVSKEAMWYSIQTYRLLDRFF